MKSLIDTIDFLQQLNTDISKKDNLISKYNQLFKIVTKMFNDKQFIESDSYFIFKNNYINDYIKLYDEVNLEKNVSIEPTLIVECKKTKTKINEDNESVTSSSSKHYNITSFDPYAPRSTNFIPKIETKQIKKKTDMYVLLLDDGVRCLLNPVNLKIYSFENKLIGSLSDNKIQVNDISYDLSTIGMSDLNDSNYKKITEDHVIIIPTPSSNNKTSDKPIVSSSHITSIKELSHKTSNVPVHASTSTTSNASTTSTTSNASNASNVSNASNASTSTTTTTTTSASVSTSTNIKDKIKFNVPKVYKCEV